MTLTDAELNCQLWLKLLAHWNDELSALRASNDGDMDELKTAALRGRIKQIKRNLDIGNPKPAIEID
ncbi:MAG: hypothetical protein ACD_23C00889G0003 [uncultured bacterium]|nr:MAG: hypothetical protein ACD_23C00889G0003 [uncultured bacterium]KKT73227.1 MAG: hypothetical protein UW69_C0070G0008 [Microgenomates group bacterium GW2011_GWA2_44_7]